MTALETLLARIPEVDKLADSWREQFEKSFDELADEWNKKGGDEFSYLEHTEEIASEAQKKIGDNFLDPIYEFLGDVFTAYADGDEGVRDTIRGALAGHSALHIPYSTKKYWGVRNAGDLRFALVHLSLINNPEDWRDLHVSFSDLFVMAKLSEFDPEPLFREVAGLSDPAPSESLDGSSMREFITVITDQMVDLDAGDGKKE